jgi:hypothetical protein
MAAALVVACLPATMLAAETSTENKPVKCSVHNSARATVEQIATDPDQYQGHCVAIDGTMQGSSLFDSVDGVYVQPTDSMDPSSSGLRLGLDHIDDYYSDRYRGVKIVGRVQDCETVRNCVHSSAGEDEIVFISGYCHSNDGAYLWVTDLRFRRSPVFKRQTGSSGRDDYGDLIVAPANWLNLKSITTLANDFLKALQSSDANKLADIHFRNVGLQWEDDEATMLKFLLNDRRSPFNAIRTATTPPQQIILLDRSSLADEQSSDQYSATVCFCRESDCTGRWPIASFDADNIRSRPYACTRIDSNVHGQQVVPRFTTEIGTEGLAEP